MTEIFRPSSKFKALLEELRNLDLPLGEYAVYGSGPLAIRGIRDAKDLDIVVTRTLWKQLSSQHPVKEFLDTKKAKLADNIDAVFNLPNFGADTETFISLAEIIDGLPFIRLENLLICKKLMGGLKHLKDIKLTEVYLNQRGVSTR